MKAKYIKITYALAALLGCSSCGDFLEVEPQDKIILDKFWNERADVESVVSSCYSSLQSSACIKRMMIWGEARSENMDAGNNMDKDVNLENIFKANITSTNPYTTWVDFYYVINTCNTCRMVSSLKTHSFSAEETIFSGSSPFSFSKVAS